MCITRVVASPLGPNICVTMPFVRPILSLSSYRTILILILILLVGIGPADVEGALQRTKKKSAQTSKKRSTKTQSKRGTKTVKGATSKRSTSKKKARRTRQRVVPLSALTVLSERELSPGIRYAQYRSNGSKAVVVHVISMDRTVPGNALRLIKGEDHATGLERLGDMARRYDTASNNQLFAVVNGNFWRAVRNTMIGPCVIDGEVVELNPYKKWTSAFVDVKSQVIIDTFALTGTVRLNGRTFPISSVNRRNDTGVVVYNDYGGDNIPHVNTKEIEKAFQEAVKDSIFTDKDSTEVALTKDVLKNEILRAQREANGEYPMVKVRVRYLRSPSVNVPFPCMVLGVDTGTVAMPLRGAVVSFPRAMLNGAWPRQGDTLLLTYSTNKHSSTRFMNAVCGTPRLVRNGIPKHEAHTEGSTGRRFIQDNLARTALGVDRSGNRIVLAAIRPDRPEDRAHGATLQQTAQIMALLGCYNAMNLDGGGSTGMVVGNDHVFFDGADPLTRRVGLGVGVVKLSKILRAPPR